MTLSDITSFSKELAALLAASTAIFACIYKRINDFKKSTKGLRDSIELQLILDEVLAAVKADRVLLFHSHNCGDYPKMDKPYFVTLIECSTVDPMKKIELIKAYNDMRVDSSYRRMVVDLKDSSHRRVSLLTEFLPEGILKTTYQMEGITHSEVSIIKDKKRGEMYYMSVATTREKGFTDDEILKIKHGENRVIKKMSSRRWF